MKEKMKEKMKKKMKEKMKGSKNIEIFFLLFFYC